MSTLQVKMLAAQVGWPAYSWHDAIVGEILPARLSADGKGYYVTLPEGVGKKSEYYFMSCEVEVL